MNKLYIILLALLPFFTSLSASPLIDKLVVVDRMLDGISQNKLISIFEDFTMMGESFKSISGIAEAEGELEALHGEVYQVLTVRIQRVLTQLFTNDELDMLESLYQSGREGEFLVAKIFCKVVDSDRVFVEDMSKIFLEYSRNTVEKIKKAEAARTED